MLAIALGLFTLLVLRDKKGRESTFFDIQASVVLRGFWSIIILLVHVPVFYQNPIQDMLGSFAYVGVTFFFMTSGYGLTLGVLKNQGAVQLGFWRKRLPKLLLPMLLTNIISVLVNFLANQSLDLLGLISITGFVRQLLAFYFIFWAAFAFLPKKLTTAHKGYIVCALIVAFSITVYIFKNNGVFGWPTETFGFAYGVILGLNFEKFKNFASKKWFLKLASTCALSLILGVSYLKYKSIIFAGDYLNKIVLGLFILLFMLFINIKFPLGNVVSRFLGKISYEIYLLHSVSFTILTSLPLNLNSGIFILVSILITVLLSVAVNYIKEKLCQKN